MAKTVCGIWVFIFAANPVKRMAAVDGWVNDVDDVLSKAEHSYRQITEDTTTDEKRMLLADAKRLVDIVFA